MLAERTSYLPYHEPGIVTILIQSSFLLVLNILNSAFDSLIYCGLLAQVFIGVAWGTSGGGILGREFENVAVQLGYLGLILLVYEGGLSTNIKSLKSNLLLSSLVALTGLALPIGLSFTLSPLLNATPLQCFAAGAALCSTSLGTTFTILRTSGLAKSKLGVVLASAAMMDDVVGLVLVQVISNLGSAGSGTFSWQTVVRPLGVSLAFAVGAPIVCWVVSPLARRECTGKAKRMLGWKCLPFVFQTVFLLGMVTVAIYAGTSSLFAAYLAGAAVTWWDEVRFPIAEEKASASGSGETAGGAQGHVVETDISSSPGVQSSISSERGSQSPHQASVGGAKSGIDVFEKFYAPALNRILKPFFFASIGFAIPITEMFDSQIVWRGIVYTILMMFAKLGTGLWLVRLDLPRLRVHLPLPIRKMFSAAAGCLGSNASSRNKNQEGGRTNGGVELRTIKENHTKPLVPNSSPATGAESSTSLASTDPTPQSQRPNLQKPLSLYPAAMLGTAMTARGEIGFLIASVAATTGLFDNSPPGSEEKSGSSEIYLVVTWAVLLCTIFGPLSVGSLVRRVKRLEGKAGKGRGRKVDGPLGVWGLE